MTIGQILTSLISMFLPMPMQAIVSMLHEVRLTGRQTLVYHVAHHRMAHLQTFTKSKANISGCIGCIWGLCESCSKCTSLSAALLHVTVCQMTEVPIPIITPYTITISNLQNHLAGRDLRATRRELNDNLRVSSNSFSLWPVQKPCLIIISHCQGHKSQRHNDALCIPWIELIDDGNVLDY